MSFEVIEVEQEGNITLATRTLARWVPPDSLANELPVSHEICFDLYVDANGNRRFHPRNGDWRSLIVHCFNTGLIIQGLDARAASNARLNFYAFIWMKYRQDFATRRFLRSQDFAIRRNSRVVRNQTSVLADLRQAFPEFCDLNESLGRTPDSTKKFYRSLYDVASRIPPFETDQDNRLAIIRESFLVHRNRLPTVTESQIEEVRERFWKQLDQNFDRPDFTEWLTSSRTNLPSVIKRMEGSVDLTRPEANSALFELGALGLHEVATSLHTTMREISDSIVDLNETERGLFDSIYLGSEHLGGFPLLALMYRHDFLRPAVMDLWNMENNLDEVAPAVLNLLHFYSIMINSRRAADRQGQRRRLQRNVDGSLAIQTQINEQIAEDRSVGASLPFDVIESIGLRCDKCSGQNLNAGFIPNESDIDFHFTCRDCDSDFQEVSRPIEDLRQRFEDFK